MIKLFGFASIHLRPIAEYVMLTEGRSARDLLRKKIALQQQGAKKKHTNTLGEVTCNTR